MRMPAATLLLLAAPLVPALHLPARALSRRALLSTTATAAAAAVLPPSVSWADAELAQVEGYGYAIAVPRSYYRPQGRPRTGLDDTIFSAADFATGRTASVSRTSAVDLLLDSGDPTVAQLPPPVELRELGKPAKVAALLARRRDGDPRGMVRVCFWDEMSQACKGSDLVRCHPPPSPPQSCRLAGACA